MKKNKRFNILGVKISALNLEDMINAVEDTISADKKNYVCVCPVSTIMACQNSAEAFKSVNSAKVTVPDGMPIAWIGKAKGYKNLKRIPGTELMRAACKLSESKGYRNYFYGSTKKTLSNLEEKVMKKFPRLNIVGTHSPPFRDLSLKESDKIIDMINEAKPDILWVGLGSPKQDIWMHRNRKKLDAPLLIGVGAAFDFLAETKKRAPGFMQRLGLEWLYRFILEPGRLWKRYLVYNVVFVYFILKEYISHLFFKKTKHSTLKRKEAMHA